MPQVASQMSEDKARQGGSLGWKTRQDVVGVFADAAFKLGVSTAFDAAMYLYARVLGLPACQSDAYHVHIAVGWRDDASARQNTIWVRLCCKPSMCFKPHVPFEKVTPAHTVASVPV